MDIAGKVFIVTGGASGLGEGSARLLVREGAKVVIADLQADRGQALATELGAATGQATFVRCDVSQDADGRAAVAAALALGPLFGLVKERIAQPDCANGFLFDGFPRTLPQADAMKTAGVKLDLVLEIDVPDAAIIERMSGRRVHQPSGRSYHLKFNPPKVAGKDDVTGDDLIQRDDDSETTVRHRLDVYQSQTRPLVEYYASWAASGDAQAPRYARIAGLGTVDEITARAMSALQG